MVGITIGINTRDIESIEEAFQQAPKTMNKLVNTRLKRDIGQRMRVKLLANPPKPTYPLTWTSEKQRRYVMAKLRKANNLPYRRTGALIDAWQFNTETNERGGLVEVVNTSPIARYVYGDQRQPMFPQWQDIDVIFAEELEIVDKEIETIWFEVHKYEFA